MPAAASPNRASQIAEEDNRIKLGQLVAAAEEQFVLGVRFSIGLVVAIVIDYIFIRTGRSDIESLHGLLTILFIADFLLAMVCTCFCVAMAGGLTVLFVRCRWLSSRISREEAENTG